MWRAWQLLLAVTMAGCVGDGTGTLSGTLYVRGCTFDSDFGAAGAPAPFDMHPHFFAADPINAPGNGLTSSRPLHPVNKATIRMQHFGTSNEEADLLFVTISDDAAVVAALGQPMTVGPTTSVRATLTLNETCPQAEVQAELDGSLTFSRFGGTATVTDGIQFGDPISASFDFDIVDRRAISIGGIGAVPVTPATSGHVSGNFDFVVRQGKAAQAY